METAEAANTKSKLLNDKNIERKKKVLMLIPNLDFGGAQKVFYELALFLSRKYEICEGVFNLDYGHAYPTENRIVTLDVPAGKNVLDKLKQFIVRCRKYKRLKEQEGASISISHMEGANYVNILSGGSTKNIIVVHGSKLAHDKNRKGLSGWLRLKLLIPVTFKKATHIVTVSRDIKRELTDYFGIPHEKITVINNSFDINRITCLTAEPMPSRYQSVYIRPVIVASGRLAEQKNQIPLLDILAKVKKEVSCSLVILGEGHLKDILMARAKALGLSTFTDKGERIIPKNVDVYFLGYQSNPFQFIAKADLFVLPSDWEGFPLALCEAMICGVPVMSTDCPTGPREILAPETNNNGQYNLQTPEHAAYGILMPLLNGQASISIWAKEIIAVMRDSELRRYYGQKGREKVQDFSQERIMERWIDVIES